MSIELANPDIVGALIGGVASVLAAIVTVALSIDVCINDLQLVS